METFSAMLWHTLSLVVWYIAAFILSGVQADSYSITDNPNTIHIAKTGEDLNITCEYDDKIANLTLYNPYLKWYKGDTIIFKEKIEAPRTFFWTIKNPQFEDSDIYSCGITDIGLIETVTIRFGALPSKPINFRATSTDRVNINASWEAGMTSNLPTQYKFEFRHQYPNSCQYSGVNYVPCQNWNSCLIENAGACTEFLFKVTAENSLGEEIFDKWTFNFFVDTIPNAPSNLNGTRMKNDGREVWDIKWDKPRDWPEDKKNSLYYQIKWWKDGQEGVIEPTILPQYKTDYLIDLGPPLTYFTNYYCQVSAKIDKGEWGPWTDVINILTAEGEPSVTVDFTWEITENNLSLSIRNMLLTWKPLTKEQSNGNIQGYEIIVKNNNNMIKNYTIDDPETTKFSINNLFYKDQEYSISMVAFNSAGKSPSSTKGLPAVPDDDISSTKRDAKLAAIVVCVGLFAIILLALFIWHIYRELKEAKKIPGIHLQIDELFAKSRLSESSRPYRGRNRPEIFDSLVPDDISFLDNKNKDLRHEKPMAERMFPPNYNDIWKDVPGNFDGNTRNSHPVFGKNETQQASGNIKPRDGSENCQPSSNYTTANGSRLEIKNDQSLAQPLNQDTGYSSHLYNQTQLPGTPRDNICEGFPAGQRTLSAGFNPYLSLNDVKEGGRPSLKSPSADPPYVTHPNGHDQPSPDTTSTCTSGIGSLPSSEGDCAKDQTGNQNLDYLVHSNFSSINDNSRSGAASFNADNQQFNVGGNGYVTNNPTF